MKNQRPPKNLLSKTKSSALIYGMEKIALPDELPSFAPGELPIVEIDITTGEASHILGVTETTIINWIRAGKLPCHVLPLGHRRIPIKAVFALRRTRELCGH